MLITMKWWLVGCILLALPVAMTTAAEPPQIWILSGSAAIGGVTFGSDAQPTVTLRDAEAIGRECAAVAGAAPEMRAHGKLVFGNEAWVPSSIVGSTPAYFDVRDWTKLAEGDIFTNSDVANHRNVCVIGTTIKRGLFKDASPIGKELQFAGVRLRVVGVLSSKGPSLMGLDQDDIVVAPSTVIKSKPSRTKNAGAPAEATKAAKTPAADQGYVDAIVVRLASAGDSQKAERQIKRLLRERHRIQAANDDDDSHDDFNLRVKAGESFKVH
jgi:putative ABC transport system permease protein